jgi:hypothetical protein
MAIDKVTTASITDANITTAKLAYDAAPFRNIIINGDMSIAQRGTSSSGITTSGYYTVDRFKFFNSSLGTFTMSQSTDVPTGQGFATSLKLDCTTADAAPAAADNLRIQQIFEGQNLQYLKKGTSSAESLTLSFWVKSTKTGTFIAELYDLDNSRQISKSYTVDVTNTWEKKTITFAGDTTGALDNDNQDSLSINFWLGAGTDYTSGTLSTTWTSVTTANRAVGQVNIADDTANDFYITGVQLEAGTTASDFEFLPYDVNFNRCRRYYQEYKINNLLAGRYNAGSGISLVQFQFTKNLRATPTYSTAGTWEASSGYAGTPTASSLDKEYVLLAGSSIAANAIEYYGGTNSYIELDAEL